MVLVERLHSVEISIIIKLVSSEVEFRISSKAGVRHRVREMIDLITIQLDTIQQPQALG